MPLTTLVMTVALHLAVTPGQTVMPADMIAARQITSDALAWWMQHDPQRRVFVLASEDVQRVPQPDGGVLPRDLATDGVAVWVYLNRNPFYRFPRDRPGTAIGTNALVLLDERRFPWSERATLAHELGHAAFGLPDRYLDDPYCRKGMDLMCNSEAAYLRGWLGCQSLAALGGACRTLYLPLAERMAPPGAPGRARRSDRREDSSCKSFH